MKDDIDFAALYAELKLSADCPMATLKHAYRRRVRELHPDLPGAVGSVEQLQRLNRLYAAALNFERQHGRLPGALPNPVAPARFPHAQPGSDIVPSPISPPGMSASRPWLRYLVLSGLAGVLLFWLAPRHDAVPEMQTTTSAPPGDAGATDVSRFEIGFDRAQVRRLQGAPFNADDEHWSYGPSWIEFRCGKVVDWYSSPLHPLHVRKARPEPADIEVAQSKEPPRC